MKYKKYLEHLIMINHWNVDQIFKNFQSRKANSTTQTAWLCSNQMIDYSKEEVSTYLRYSHFGSLGLALAVSNLRHLASLSKRDEAN